MLDLLSLSEIQRWHTLLRSPFWWSVHLVHRICHFHRPTCPFPKRSKTTDAESNFVFQRKKKHFSISALIENFLKVCQIASQQVEIAFLPCLDVFNGFVNWLFQLLLWELRSYFSFLCVFFFIKRGSCVCHQQEHFSFAVHNWESAQSERKKRFSVNTTNKKMEYMSRWHSH